jgi:CubicO group peptidase (beta-lactamase class C family)
VDHEHWTGRLAGLASEAGVPGAVLGVWHDGAATVAPYGVLSARTGVTTTADSVFQIGSITKTWTGTMIAQLVEEGRLSYDATVAELLPGVQLGRDDASASVTVRHLLSHSSGLDGDVFTDTGRGDDCVERYMDLLGDLARTFEPGAAYSYCNSGFVVLGRIIEVLDGCTWDASLRARLVEPLGLTDTVTLPEEAILRRAAVGHRGTPHAGEPVATWVLPRAIAPAGLITTTAADLLGYARLHLDRGTSPTGERVVGEDAILAMREQQQPIPEQRQFAGIGLSWRVGRWSGREVLAHDGGTIGQTAFLRLMPAEGLAVCLLTNSANGLALADLLLPEVFGEVAGVEVPPPAAPDPDVRPDGLERHAGHYARFGVDFDVAVADGRLDVTIDEHFAIDTWDEPETVELVPADGSGDRFVGRSDPSEAWWAVTFATLPDGRPQLFSSGRVAPRV